MAKAYKEGDTVWNAGRTAAKKLTGGKWVDVPLGQVGSPVPKPPKLEAQDRTFLNNMTAEAKQAADTLQDYKALEPVIRRFKPGPFRAAFVDANIVNEADGPVVRAGKGLLSAITRPTGMLNDQDIEDYQTITRAKNKAVLEAQLPQKGVQTEGDAARMAMAGISPYKRLGPSLDIFRENIPKAQRQILRDSYYKDWAAKYGSNRTNERGQSVEQAFQADVAAGKFKPEATGYNIKPRGFKLLKD